MTIAAGFVCSDGILLASDTLWDGGTKRHGRKLWHFEAGRISVVFAGSGTETAIMRLTDGIRRHLKPTFTYDQVLKQIETDMRYIIGDPHPALAHTQVLIGVRMPGKSALHENIGNPHLLGPVTEHTTICIGIGDALGNYVASTCCQHGPLMSLRWARVVASHVVHEVKEFTGGCDGDTHLLEVPHVGPPRFVDDQVEIASYEHLMREVDLGRSDAIKQLRDSLRP